MQAVIGNRFLAALRLQHKPYEVRDTKLKGFILRVQPSGVMSYVCEYGRGKRITIGKTDKLTPAQARDKATELLSKVRLGEDPQAARKAAKAGIFGDYLAHEYGPWVETHSKTGKATLARLKSAFPDLQKKKPADITAWLIEKWRSARLKAGTSPATVNRDLAALKASLSKAVEWGIIETHPLAKVKLSKVDDKGVVRYLDDDEEGRLREALDAREEKARAGRDNANAWRRERGYELLPDLRKAAFVDHLKPMTLVALNTGLRRGELLGLTWENVDLKRAVLTVTGETAKSNKTRHVPLNAEALDVLKGWKKQATGSLVFPGHNGERMASIKTAWLELMATAKIKNFRFHDCRHHFASRLVMAGVDLNTVRELLGHGDIKMTLRYAHLAPEHKAAAVARLMTIR